jgi:protein-tyrosine phosphatase
MNHTRATLITIRGIEIDSTDREDIALAKEFYDISEDEINEAISEANREVPNNGYDDYTTDNYDYDDDGYHDYLESAQQLNLFNQQSHDHAWRSPKASKAKHTWVKPKKTSESNPLKPSYINVGEGKLGLFICPGKVGQGISGDHERNLQADLAVLQSHKMSVLFGLMPGYELTQYKSDGLLTECADYEIDYRHVGWTDRSTPDNDTFADDVREAAEALWNGQVVGVHCRGGLGRTGSFAGCVLADSGFAVDEILSLLRDARGYMCPETDAQKTFVKTWAVQRMIQRDDKTKIKDLEAVAIYNALRRSQS